MLRIIYGMPGAGKTYRLYGEILKALSEGKHVTLLVPEQEVMEAERRIADRADAEGIYCENLTVVSFRRLANLAFRKYGGIEYQYIDDGGKLLIIWRIVEELAPVLKAFGKSRDRALCEMLLSVCTELKRYRIAPSVLSSKSDVLPPSPLRDKLCDISLIYTAYYAVLKEEYSDPQDDVERLARILKEHSFLSDSLLYADSFNGFTASELKVLEYCLLSCDLTLTLCRPQENGRTGFMTVEKTERDIIGIAEKHGVKIEKITELYSKSSHIPEEFKLIEDKLWELSFKSEKNFFSDRVTLTSCRDRFSEAEYIACRICGLVRQGSRYRDIAIIGRGTEEYEGVLEVVFARYGIPLFSSTRSSLSSSALYRCFNGALEVIYGGFKREDILSYVKTGLCGLDISDIDILESYTTLWNISGSRWTDEYDWNMNPDGLNDAISESSFIKLKHINRLRRQICGPLIKLKDSLKNGVTLKEACASLYLLINESGAYDYIRTSSDSSDITVYNIFVSLLDTVVAVGYDIPVNAKVLSSLLQMAAKYTDFGKIPQSFDCVVSGDASILRANGRSHIFLIACESGNFPRAVTDDSVFSDTEKSLLYDNGIELSPNTAVKTDEEMFFFLRAACSASETITATYVKNGKNPPSSGFTRLCALFPGNRISHYPDEFTLTDRIQTLDTALPITYSAYGTTLYAVMRELYEKHGKTLPSHRIPLSETEVKISESISKKLFGKHLNLTQYRLEDYAKCPFSYYCRYILRLNEKRHSAFRTADVGTYIHRILEKVISTIFPPGSDMLSPTEDELDKIIDRAVNEILNSALGESFVSSGRFGALLLRLRRTVKLIIKNLLSEFENSSFRPSFFELKIGSAESGVKPLQAVLPDGRTISVYGTIDRVDTYKENDDVYIRVVDYKTGSRKHSLKNIALGIDMQMLLYLFAFWRTDNPTLKKKLGISENGHILPAGVLYHTSRIETKTTERPVTSEEALTYAESKLIRSGILLKDENVLSAMENGLSGRFIPVTMKKDQLKMTHGELKTLEEFGELLSEVSDVLVRIGSSILSGDASARPIKNPQLSPCGYCAMSVVCRNARK